MSRILSICCYLVRLTAKLVECLHRQSRLRLRLQRVSSSRCHFCYFHFHMCSSFPCWCRFVRERPARHGLAPQWISKSTLSCANLTIIQVSERGDSSSHGYYYLLLFGEQGWWEFGAQFHSSGHFRTDKNLGRPSAPIHSKIYLNFNSFYY